MPGMGEMIVILLIVLLIFGAGKLPEIGDALGRVARGRVCGADSERGLGSMGRDFFER